MLRYYFLCLGFLSFLLYGLDKIKAKFNLSRIPESVLLRLSLFGGVYGSILGMFLFHHKTRKKLFIKVNTICFIVYTIFIYIMWRYVWN